MSAAVLVRLPNWVGDVVMATPVLRALRRARPADRIVAMGKPFVRDLLSGSPWIDDWIPIGRDTPKGTWGQSGALRVRGPFDVGLLLTNSLGSALVMRLGGVRRRIGYAREGRGVFLTDRLRPPREADGSYRPTPMVNYYSRLLEPLGIAVDDTRFELFVTDEDRRAMDELLATRRRRPERRLVVLNPGAAFGSAKCYPPESFAEVARRLDARGDVEVMVVCGPKEREVAHRISADAGEAVTSLADDDVPLGMLKALVARCDLLITNDSGPRHFAPALGRPVVTIVGPTDPRWSESGYEREIVLNAEVECAPCMQRTCPEGHHRCMLAIDPSQVVEAADRQLRGLPRSGDA